MIRTAISPLFAIQNLLKHLKKPSLINHKCNLCRCHFLTIYSCCSCAAPTGPLTLIISTSNVSTSPGTTFPLNFALLTPPKNAIFPLYSSAESAHTAPVCANASMINYPRHHWFLWKMSCKNGSLYVTHFLPTIRFPSSISSIRSTNKMDFCEGIVFIISLISITIINILPFLLDDH